MASLKKILFLLFFLGLLYPACSQYYKKRGNSGVLWSIGGGVAGGDAKGLSYYGPDFEYGFRKTVLKMGSYMNCSFDFIGQTYFGVADMGYLGNKWTGFQSFTGAFNFNALAGAYPPGKKVRSGLPVGAFLGLGLTGVTLPSGLSGGGADFGPYFNFGLRFKTSKSYFMELKVFGAIAAMNEFAYGGLNLKFPLGLKSEKKRKSGGHSGGGGG